MTKYAALLRAINVGGTGKLAMTDLAALCTKAGFTDVTTYIQSGNVVFGSRASEAAVTKTLEQLLAAKLGKPVGVMVRTNPELVAVLAANPFPEVAPNRVIVAFLPSAPPKDALVGVKAPGGERLALGRREIYVAYPEGQGSSKLKVPFASVGTGRNLNTIAKLAALTALR